MRLWVEVRTVTSTGKTKNVGLGMSYLALRTAVNEAALKGVWWKRSDRGLGGHEHECSSSLTSLGSWGRWGLGRPESERQRWEADGGCGIREIEGIKQGREADGSDRTWL